MGRVGVDIYPQQIGVGLEDVTTFGKYLGGSATNVAIAAARLGRRSAVITRTGDDPFGRFVHQALVGFGVDDRFVSSVPRLATPVVFCEIFPPDDFPLYFYREPKAPDMEIRADELDLDALGSGRRALGHRHRTVGRAEPRSHAHRACVRDKRHPTILDLDYRPMFWDSREQAQQQVSAALDLVTCCRRQSGRVRDRRRHPRPGPGRRCASRAWPARGSGEAGSQGGSRADGDS